MPALMLAALAQGTFFGVGPVVATALVPLKRKASNIAVMFTGLTVANILGAPLGTPIGQQFGRRATLWSATAVGVIALIVIGALVPKDAPPSENSDWRADMRAILRAPVLLCLFTTVLGYAGVFAVFI